MNTLLRRGFIAAGAAVLAYAQLPRIMAAQGAVEFEPMTRSARSQSRRTRRTKE